MKLTSDGVSYKVVFCLLFLLSETLCVPAPSAAPPPGTTTAANLPANSTDANPTTNTTDEPVKLERSGKVALSDEGTQETPSKKDAPPTTLITKLATDGEHPIQQELSGDAPPPPSEKIIKETEPKDGKTSDLQTVDVAVAKPIKLSKPTNTPMSHEDTNIRKSWGGNCTLAIWNVCNRIKSWGGNYLVPDKSNPDKMHVKSFKINCVEKPEKTFCLKNGWTVARCHMLCMSQCNLEYRQNYDKLVLHEGECRNPILGKK